MRCAAQFGQSGPGRSPGQRPVRSGKRERKELCPAGAQRLIALLDRCNRERLASAHEPNIVRNRALSNQDSVFVQLNAHWRMVPRARSSRVHTAKVNDGSAHPGAACIDLWSVGVGSQSGVWLRWIGLRVGAEVSYVRRWAIPRDLTLHDANM